jgi:hypothetical protein
MKKWSFIAIGLLVSSAALGTELRCFQDMRPVDGNYREILLIEQAGKYNLISKTVTSGFGTPSQTFKKVLARAISCRIDGIVAYCFRARTGGENSNSIVTFSVVQRTQLSSLNQQIASKSPERVEIKVISPAVANGTQTYEFIPSAMFSGCETN